MGSPDSICSVEQTRAATQPRTGWAERYFSQARFWLRDLLLSLLLVFAIVAFLYQPVQVEGTSMMPRLANNERVFVNKLIYKIESIRRGDVVVFSYPMDPSKSFIKRVVGLPGDSVKIVAGRVYINGKLLDEPYVSRDGYDGQSLPPVTVESDHYFVMGDHRVSSNDSRIWGTVDRKYIFGKAVLVYWPFREFGPINSPRPGLVDDIARL